MKKRVRKAVFPVAGLGTRFLPATKVLAKEMLPLLDRPLIQHAVEEAIEAGIEEFIFVSSRNKSVLEDHFDRVPDLEEILQKRNRLSDLDDVKRSAITPGSLHIVRQQQPLGLGHAIWCARHLIRDEPFAVLLPDDVIMNDKSCLAQMCESFAKDDTVSNMMAVMEVPEEQTSRYGIVDVASKDHLFVHAKGLVEKPDPQNAPSRFAIIGRYILDSKIFDALSQKKTGHGGEIQLTDSMQELIDGGQSMAGFLFEGKRFDCGTKAGWLAANIAYAKQDKEFFEDVEALLIA